MPKSRSNGRNTRGLRGRQVDITPARTRFLIVCEGARTEPGYFKCFPVPSADIVIIGEGYNTVSLVERTKELQQQHGFDEDTDQVWCVFDKDDFPAEDFNNAIEKAKKYGFRVAYTNQAFELWYLLHFDFHESNLHRDQYIIKLTDKLGKKYEKNSARMYETLRHMQPQAIRHAQRLYEQRTSSPANDNPSTTVFMLVEELNKYLK